MTDEGLAAYIIDTFEAGYPAGKFTDHPDDLGGPTRWGITRTGLAEFLRVRPREITVDQIRAVTRDYAIEICQELVFLRPGIFRIADWRPRLVTADFSFNAGVDDGIPALQRAVRTTPDGVFGPISLAKTNQMDPVACAVRAVAFRQKVHYRRAVGRQLNNYRGWMDRCTTLLLKVTA